MYNVHESQILWPAFVRSICVQSTLCAYCFYRKFMIGSALQFHFFSIWLFIICMQRKKRSRVAVEINESRQFSVVKCTY